MRLATVLAIAIGFHASSARSDYFSEDIPLHHKEPSAIADGALPPQSDADEYTPPRSDYFHEEIPLRHKELPAIAGENLPPRPEGKGWRRVTNFGGETDSTCIGHAKTPLCAIETRYACFARTDDTLCEIVWPATFSDDPQLRKRLELWPDAGQIVDFKVIGIESFKQSDFTSNVRVHWIPKKGDLLAGLAVRKCFVFPGPAPLRWTCSRYHPTNQEMYHLRRVRGLWQIIDFDFFAFFNSPIDPETGFPAE
ncbi:MAG: hypothetical protein ACKVSF_12360 [Alphaproteobacteria bacterium]